MYINTFKYTPADVDCKLCTEYVKKFGCTACGCPWMAERIEAGVVGYAEVVRQMFPHDKRLMARLEPLIRDFPGMLWKDERHRQRMEGVKIHLVRLCGPGYSRKGAQGMKPLHLPLEGHDLLAVERFKDDTRHMAEFLILSTHCPLGRRGQYKRLFLTEDEYARMRSLERQGQLQIRRHAAIIEGHILPDKPKKRRH